MLEFAFPPGLAVVAFGLLSAASWGAADFGGGLTSRRAPLLGVTLFMQLVGMIVVLGLWVAVGQAVPGPADVAWSALAGVIGAIGIAALYQALAVGKMSVVAPVTGVLGAIIPVVVGIASQGWPPPLVVVGIALALVAVVLVSVVADSGHIGPSGLPYAILAGLGIGLFSIVISQVTDGLLFGPLFVVRLVEVVVFTVVIALARRPWRLSRATWGPVIVVGALDMGGNAFFIAAIQTGALAIAGVLGSLYPVITVVLAAFVLRERIGGVHAVGIGAAALAIALIAGGSAG